MMTQEEFMDVLAMRRAGMTFTEIAIETGYHPATISKWCREGGPPAARTIGDEERVVDPVWADRLTELLVGNSSLLATSLFEIIRAEGFDGSYPTVARWVREQRGPRFRRADAASVPIETAPGEEAQFDFSDCSAWSQRVGLGPVLWCFSMILCWSRWRLWWFTTSVDREHTFEGLVRFFEAAGGVPQVCRTDRMGALGQSQGRRFKLHPPTLEFARHHGTEIKACQSGDAKRKGKVERPFRDLSESFLEELVVTGLPDDLDALNGRARLWSRNGCMTAAIARPASNRRCGSPASTASCAGCRDAGSTPTTSSRGGCIGRCRSSSGNVSATRSHRTVLASSSRSASRSTATS